MAEYLTKTQFLAMTGLGADQYRGLRQRDLIPLDPRAVRQRDRYTPFETLLTFAMNQIVREGIVGDFEVACRFVRNCTPALEGVENPLTHAIVRHYDLLSEVVLAEVTCTAGRYGDRGTLPEVAERAFGIGRRDHGPFVSMVAVNIGLIATPFHHQAKAMDLDLHGEIEDTESPSVGIEAPGEGAGE